MIVGKSINKDSPAAWHHLHDLPLRALLLSDNGREQQGLHFAFSGSWGGAIQLGCTRIRKNHQTSHLVVKSPFGL